jgi:transcriptional regulator with XRE-family HTH domain
MLAECVNDAVRRRDHNKRRMETLGARIKALREARGLTLQDLADLCGVTRQAVQQWESGATADIKLDPFLRLAKALATDPWFLKWGPTREPSALGRGKNSSDKERNGAA